MKVLIDTNIILDSLLEREPFVEDADALFEAIENEQIEGYVTATTLTNIFYIVRRQTRSLDRARQAIAETLALMKVSAVDRHVLEIAFASNLTDFEDAVQLACALSDNLEVIVTRDAGDFAGATLPILSPKELLERLR
ncbi:PIN domain-containing protein [Microcoleus sp. Pol14C2]|uniref:PIN domain-containing protein n=1 Tax=unclassified Microcoleus TaxID=2642155 RepID=UPI002FCFB898